MKYKVIIIENERDIVGSLKGFLKDNPDLFSETTLVSQARHRPEAVGEKLKEGYNAIMVSSTFIYKDQLEDNVKLFSDLNLTFFVEHAVSSLNGLLSTFLGVPETYGSFKNYDTFIKTVIGWVEKGLVYSIVQDLYQSERIFDEFHGFSTYENQWRGRWEYELVKYSEKFNMFFSGEEEDCLDNYKYIHSK
jgi:hypothetical protein